MRSGNGAVVQTILVLRGLARSRPRSGEDGIAIKVQRTLAADTDLGLTRTWGLHGLDCHIRKIREEVTEPVRLSEILSENLQPRISRCRAPAGRVSETGRFVHGRFLLGQFATGSCFAASRTSFRLRITLRTMLARSRGHLRTPTTHTSTHQNISTHAIGATATTPSRAKERTGPLGDRPRTRDCNRKSRLRDSRSRFSDTPRPRVQTLSAPPSARGAGPNHGRVPCGSLVDSGQFWLPDSFGFPAVSAQPSAGAFADPSERPMSLR